MSTVQKHPDRIQPYRVDIHHHILPPKYVLALEDIGIDVNPFPEWTPQKSLDIMDKNGIATAITSISTPGVYFKDAPFSRELARRCNEYTARLISDYPDRFGAFASLPLPDVEGALLELEYAIDALKLDGVVIFSNVEGKYPSGPEYREFFAELNRRQLVAFIHPNERPRLEEETRGAYSPFVEYPIDTGRIVARWLHDKTLEHNPDIRFILAHAGGNVPFMAERMSRLHYVNGTKPRMLKIIAYMVTKRNEGRELCQHLYYDTAASASNFALRSLQELVEPAHILFGSNYVWTPDSIIPTSMRELEVYDGFDEEALTNIECKNALELFPRFKGQ